MTRSVRSTMKKINASIEVIADSHSKALYDEVRKDAERNQGVGTPVREGRAQRGWKYKDLGNGESRITNKVPYIGNLDEGSSKKAPKGIVKPAIKKIENRFGKTRRR